MREIFFLNQLKVNHRVSLHNKADFLVDDKYVFEIGGKSKKFKQIEGDKNAFIVSDEIETGIYNRVPLWLFGLLY